MRNAPIHDIAESFESRSGWTVHEVNESFGYIEFSGFETNYKALGDVAAKHGCVVTAWNPKKENPRVYFGRAEDVLDVDKLAAAAQPPSFEDYLRENVFTKGGYWIGEHGENTVAVSEFKDGGGYVCDADMKRALDDENVEIITVDHGKLILKDDRNL